MKEIDGLRALAIGTVLIYHFKASYLPLGNLGVDVFFAISGYVITKSIRERMAAGNFTVDEFFMRRAKRLLPALAVMTAVSMLMAELLLTNKAALGTGAGAFFGLSNIVLWYYGVDYFGGGENGSSIAWNPLGHTWSLGVEEQFYLLFPFLLLIVRGRSRLAFWLLGFVMLATLPFYLWLLPSHHMAAFYLTPCRFWELMAGGLAYLVFRRWNRSPSATLMPWLKWFMPTVLLVVMLSRIPEQYATVVCILASCGALYLSGIDSAPNPALTNPIAVFAGKISYSIYLWHWPVIVFAKLLLPPLQILPAYVLATTVLSLCSYYGIERPLRYRRWTWLRDRFLYTYPAYGMAAAVITAALFAARPVVFLGPEAMLEKSLLLQDQCHDPDSDGLAKCLTKSNMARPTVWLLGDSHAGSLAIGLRNATRTLDLGFRTLTGTNLVWTLRNQCKPQLCPNGSFEDFAAKLKAVSRPGDYVFISFATSSTPFDENFARNLATFAGALRSHGLNIVFVEDVPTVCGDSGEFLSSAFRKGLCNKPVDEALKPRLFQSQVYADIQRHQPVEILDPHTLFCRPSGSSMRCSNWLGNKLLYIDSSPHLTYWASASLTDFFSNALRSMVASHRAH